MRPSPRTVLAAVAVLALGACGSDDSAAIDTPSGEGTTVDQESPASSDALDEKGNFEQPAVVESGSITIAGESFDLVVDECKLSKSKPFALLIHPDPDNELFAVVLKSSDDGPTLLVRSRFDVPSVPAFVAEQASFEGVAGNLDFSSTDGINTYSGSNITIDNRGAGEPLTVERFEVSCADPGF